MTMGKEEKGQDKQPSDTCECCDCYVVYCICRCCCRGPGRR